jgi:hypothetical protein
MMKKNIKYMKKIEDIAKHACYCYKTLCFTFQIHLAFKLYFKKIQIIKKRKIEDPIFICNLCWKKIDYGKQLNMILCEHITNNQLSFNFVSLSNKIEEHLIAPCLAFA